MQLLNFPMILMNLLIIVKACAAFAVLKATKGVDPTRMGVLVIAGPNSRKLLAKLTDTDLSNAAFPWLTGTPASPSPTTAGGTTTSW